MGTIVVRRNGRRVAGFLHRGDDASVSRAVEKACGYVSDASSHAKEAIAEETRLGNAFVDDAGVSWTIDEEGQ